MPSSPSVPSSSAAARARAADPRAASSPHVTAFALVALLVGPLLGGCGDTVVLHVASDRPVPAGLDAICVGLADRDLGGGSFGAMYRLEGALAALPQTLRVESGTAAAAFAWVRGDAGGVPVARAAMPIDFGGDVQLTLARCERGPGAPPVPVGAAAGPAGARLAVSQGAGGQVVIAVSEGESAVLDATGGALVVIGTAPPVPPPGPIVALIAADLDGDCDDDIVLATANAAPVLWRRDGLAFVESGTLGDAPIAALAAADVDRDSDVDLVTGGGASLVLWRNDGAGTFAPVPEALGGAGHVAAVSALALGDLDRDGNPDLVVGQQREPLAAWLGEPSGTGSFLYAPGVVPPVRLDATRIVLADADGDLDPDLVVAVSAGPARLYVDREGRLEDQTFVRIPAAMPAPAIAAIAVGGWDAGCEPDVLLAGTAETVALRGQDGGTFAADAALPAASDAAFVDLDDDGDLDAVLATPEGTVWVAR